MWGLQEQHVLLTTKRSTSFPSFETGSLPGVEITSSVRRAGQRPILLPLLPTTMPGHRYTYERGHFYNKVQEELCIPASRYGVFFFFLF